jgi:hypothetical protein
MAIRMVSAKTTGMLHVLMPVPRCGAVTAAKRPFPVMMKI